MPGHFIQSKITLPRLLNFIAVVDQGTIADAARFLEAETGEGSPSSVRQNLNELRKAYVGRQLLTEHQGVQVPTVLGLEVLEYARNMVNLWLGASRLGSGTLSLSFLPHHAFFVSPVIRTLSAGGLTVHSRVLGEHDRSTEVFETQVIGGLAGGEIDLVVGPPPARGRSSQDLQQHRLYTSRMEAMVPRSDTRDSVPLGDLISEGPLLMAPKSARSHQLLLHTVAKEDLPAPDIGLESYGTKVLVAFGEDGHGTVVVPSDIADPFKNGRILGGPRSAGFKWVPIVQADGAELTLNVFATTRSRPHQDVMDTVQGILQETRKMNLDIAAP